MSFTRVSCAPTARAGPRPEPGWLRRGPPYGRMMMFLRRAPSMARALDSYGKRGRVWRPDLGERSKLESLPCPAGRPSNVPTLGTAPTSSNVDRSSNLRKSCTRFCALRIGSPDGGPVAPGLRLRSAAGGRRNAHTKSEPATRERPGLWHRRSEPSARRQLTERFGWVPSSPSWISLPRSCANATQSRGASMAIMQQTDFAEITIPGPSLAGPA